MSFRYKKKFKAERHPDVVVVNNADEFCSATGLRIEGEEAAEQFYKDHGIPFGSRFDGNIMWPKAYEEHFGNEPVNRFFETREELAEYILSGEDPNLQMYFNSYKPPKAFSLSNLYHDSGFASTMEKLGIPTAAGATLFVLYELVQYGLAIPTEGASLALPF